MQCRVTSYVLAAAVGGFPKRGYFQMEGVMGKFMVGVTRFLLLCAVLLVLPAITPAQPAPCASHVPLLPPVTDLPQQKPRR